MAPQTAARLAWSLLALMALLVAADGVLTLVAGREFDGFSVLVLVFPVVGALIAARQPRNTLAWVMLGLGGIVAFGALCRAYAIVGLELRPGSLPLPEVALVLPAAAWVPLIGVMGTFVILLFPDGHLPTPRWRGWAWFCVVGMAIVYVALLIQPGPLTEEGYPDLANPFGIQAIRPWAGAFVATIMLIPIAVVGCAVALVMRFRRSQGLERLQLRWFATASGLVAAVYLTLMLLSLPFTLAGTTPPRWMESLDSVGILAFFLIPLAIAVAILRYRLYDIDVLINRALVYGVLTAALTGAYLVVVAGLQALLRPLTGESDLAVAGATLAVAAAFRPARGRIQAFIDRRFYRSRYDAARTLEAFSVRLRDQVDLGALGMEFTTLTKEVLRPTHASLWLAPASATLVASAPREEAPAWPTSV